MKYWTFLLTLTAGALAVFGFAPWSFWPAPLLAFLVLEWVWQRALNRREAFVLGWWWGMGCFGAGISWIEVSLHDYGGMPLPLALGVITLFAAYLALFPAFAGLLSWCHRSRPVVRWLLVTPAIWTLMEWVRSWLFTGFPWLSLGYAQLPGPLAGYIPVMGVFGASWASLIVSGATMLLLSSTLARERWKSCVILLITLGLGSLLKFIPWTHPTDPSLTVSLLQGNIPQDMKFMTESRSHIIQRYNQLIFSSTGRLILLPESALPYTLEDMPPEYHDALQNWSIDSHRDILMGLFSEPVRGQYYNSVFNFGSSTPQSYHKVHLVPFGEFIPFNAVLAPLIHTVLNIPLDDQKRGPDHQPALHLAGQWIGVDICYEDAFGDEVRESLPQATILANFTNDGWFGSSIGPEQHLQMAATRALETGRPLLRVTNTGVTAIITPQGAVLSRAPRQEIATLNGTIHGMTGSTPFVMMGNYGILTVCLISLLLAWRWHPLP